jgi:hypothetical protein
MLALKNTVRGHICIYPFYRFLNLIATTQQKVLDDCHLGSIFEFIVC